MKTCSICKESKDLSCFNKNKNRKDGLQNKCKKCSRAASRDYYHNEGTGNKQAIRKRNKERREEVRNLVFNYLLHNPCVDCGEKDPVVLEFDHVSDNKKKNVSQLMSYSINTVKKEIDKCQVRCANCHRKRTAKQFGSYKLGLTG